MPLTVRVLKTKLAPGRYGDGHGLYLQVAGPNSRAWVLRYERNGKEKWMGLGSAATFSLSEARERARRARQLIADGIDPLEHRKQKRAEQRAQEAISAARNITFEEAARRYNEFHSAKWRGRSGAFLARLVKHAFPVIGKLPVASIDKALVLKVVSPIWRTRNETASRVRGRIENVLDFAKVNGWRDGDNPATWDGNLADALPAPGTVAPVKHHPALPFAELPSFMLLLRERQGIAARALEFLILTAARTGEVTHARWDEIDLTAQTWVIPAARMKMKRPHKVPLTDDMLAILTALPREGEFVFIGGQRGKPMSNMAMAVLLKRMGRDDITVHGFRSTFRDWAAETTAFANHVVEMALAHVVGNGVEAAYRRGDLFTKRTRLMADWAKYCSSPERIAATVTPIRRA